MKWTEITTLRLSRRYIHLEKAAKRRHTTYMKKTIRPRRIKRPAPVERVRCKPGPVPDPNLEKCDCNITLLLTQSEWQQFEKVRINMEMPPTRSQLARYLIRDALERRIRRDLPGNAVDYKHV